MTIQQVQLSSEEWRNFFLYYKGETHQQEAIEMLRQFINEADPSLLTQTSTWVERWRNAAPTLGIRLMCRTRSWRRSGAVQCRRFSRLKWLN